MTESLLRPSNLHRWGQCQLRAYTETLAQARTPRRRDVPHVAEFVGTSVHLHLSTGLPAPFPRVMKMDSTTPNRKTATLQVNRIVDAVRAELEARWWVPIGWEIEVGKRPPFQGTIDLIVQDSDAKYIVVDIKTGQASDGVWVQLGSYVVARLMQDDGILEPFPVPERVSLIHAPRTKMSEPQECSVVTRNTKPCFHVADRLGNLALSIIRKNHEPLPSPGYYCKGCPVEDCDVRAPE